MLYPLRSEGREDNLTRIQIENDPAPSVDNHRGLGVMEMHGMNFTLPRTLSVQNL